jgi:pantetheine-phosphate adenylyltransferase
MNDQRTALFPGTFDPFTHGHLDLTRRAARLFERVVIAVAESTAKGTMFTVEERCDLIRAATKGMRRVEVVPFSDLVVECAKRVGAEVMIRGLRAVSDFEFEFQMALMNRRLARGIEVAFLMPSQQYTYLNSTLVKEIAKLGGPIQGLVPRNVELALRAKLRAGAAAKPAAAKPAAAKPGMPAPRASTNGATKPAARGKKTAVKRAATVAAPAAPAAPRPAARIAARSGAARRR